MDRFVTGYGEMPAVSSLINHGSRVAANQHRLVLDEKVVIIKGERIGKARHGSFVHRNLPIVFTHVLQRQLEGPDDTVGEACQTNLVRGSRSMEMNRLFADVAVVVTPYFAEKPSEILGPLPPFPSTDMKLWWLSRMLIRLPSTLMKNTHR